MKLIIDENISFAKEAFSLIGNTSLVDGRIVTNKDIQDADVLIVRSITNVNEELLMNTKIKFVGTATIGTDHIDTDYLNQQDIKFVDAKGCNADSVAEYVYTALLKIASENNISLREKTIGVVGIGNIGSRVVRLAESLGMKVLKNDPPLERKSIGKNYVALNEILKADIITLHVPISYEGVDKTFHLLNENNLKLLKEGSILINSSRGAVIDNSALLNECTRKKFELVLDVWENEPVVNPELLVKTRIATPHIAGYSLEGKVNGTEIIYKALCKFLNINPSWNPKLSIVAENEIRLPDGNTIEERLYRLFASIYNIEKDDKSLRKIIQFEMVKQPEYFDSLRKEYPARREFNNFCVLITEDEVFFKPILENFRFTVKII